MPNQTLLDIAKLNGNDAVVGLIEENLTYAPELSVVPARTIKGTTYSTVIRKSYPPGSFRSANEGVDSGKSEFENKLVQCFIYSSRIEVDKAVASAYEDGVEAWEALESSGVMKQAMIEIGSQFYYGVLVDAKGFPGLQSIVDAALTEDAGGTTDDTASSVYGVKFGQQDVSFVFGQGTAFDLSDFRDETLVDGNGKKYPGRIADLCSWIGLQAVNKNAICRLKKATEDNGKGVTDAKLAKLLSKVPVGNRPDRWFMSRRSAYQLQLSRSAISQTAYKAGAFAELPAESQGIPIVVTDSIVDTEPLA